MIAQKYLNMFKVVLCCNVSSFKKTIMNNVVKNYYCTIAPLQRWFILTVIFWNKLFHLRISK